MLTQKQGGLTEWIPTPAEKRAHVIQDHGLTLLANLHQRLVKIEAALALADEPGVVFEGLMARIQAEEQQILEIHQTQGRKSC